MTNRRGSMIVEACVGCLVFLFICFVLLFTFAMGYKSGREAQFETPTKIEWFEDSGTRVPGFPKFDGCKCHD